MIRRSARPSRSSRGKGHKSANSGNSAAETTKSLKIGEAARVLGVEAYVLRFWETQFPELHPYHTASKHRLYKPEDIETLRLIKHLLYEEGFTIDGARKRIKELAHNDVRTKSRGAPSRNAVKPSNADGEAVIPFAAIKREALIEIRRDLESIYQLLKH